MTHSRVFFPLGSLDARPIRTRHSMKGGSEVYHVLEHFIHAGKGKRDGAVIVVHALPLLVLVTPPWFEPRSVRSHSTQLP